MSLFQKLAFVQSAHFLRDLPPPSDPEIAFAGRSNSGKSSAINTLAGRRRLAFVSKTPGRTQQINYFRIDGAFLVDLPGYGYAKVPLEIRTHWRGVLPQYLSSRSTLAGMVLIMDIRHPMTELDQTMLHWFLPTGRPVHILLSKADKLSRTAGTATLREVTGALEPLGSNHSVQLFSSLKGSGVDEAESVIARWLALDRTSSSSAKKSENETSKKQRAPG
jgi:GTP-binding protein